MTLLAELFGVSKRYGATVALDSVDLEVRPGEVLAVLGPNGAGKSTAIGLLLGLRRADAGRARLFGRDPKEIEARRQVGVMMQEVTLAAELRAGEHIDLVRSYYPSPLSMDEVVALTKLESLVGRPYGKLSGGQKRLVQFAMAICGRPKLLFLDEPTVGLDVETRESLWATLRSLVAAGTAVVLTTHYLEEAEALADRVAVLARGKVVATGSVGEVRALVSRKRVICSTRWSAEDVATWDGVERVGHDRQRLDLSVRNAEAVVRRIFAGDDNVQDLEVLRAGLAEAFTELTRRDVADDPHGGQEKTS